jgi:hypothetical protein
MAVDRRSALTDHLAEPAQWGGAQVRAQVLVSIATDASGPAACAQGLTVAMADHDLQRELSTTLGGRKLAGMGVVQRRLLARPDAG